MGVSALIFADPFNFQFNSASVTTALNDTIASNLTAKFDITFNVTDPDKNYNIFFDTFVATLDNGGCGERPYSSPNKPCIPFVTTVLEPPFMQLNQSKNTFPVQINVVNHFMGNDIIAARARRSIEFGLKFSVQFNTTKANTFSDKFFGVVILGNAPTSNIMRFYCQRLSFVFKSNATIADGACLSYPLVNFVHES